MPAYRSVRCVLIIFIISGLGACQRDTGDITAPPPQNRSFADAIYHNGEIYTVDDDTPWAEALAVKDGKFMVVGSNETVSGMQGRWQQWGRTGPFPLSGIIIPSRPWLMPLSAANRV